MQDSAPCRIIKRKMHAVAGELGKIDPVAMQAAQRGLTYNYQFYKNSCCMVELDEEPPKQINSEALEIVLKVAFLLNAKIIPELHIMRKTVLDGSNTAGFQRTSLVALEGILEFDGMKIGIPTICIEEDAARIIETKENEVTYNLDRLGTPLIEIATSPDIKTPEEAKKVAKAIGSLLRATRKVKRGIGTIRQDLNISISGGARVEIKGAQELNLLPKLVENEVARQIKFLEIKEILKKRNAEKGELKIFDLTGILRSSDSKILKSYLSIGGVILGIALKNFVGLLGNEVQPGRRFGTELSDYAKSCGASGIFHSDELPAYGISAMDVSLVKKELNISGNDAFVLIAGKKETCERALGAVLWRANFALYGVPNETRKALEDGNSSYLRALPGRARMYPETDLSPVLITKEKISELGKKLPELPWVEIENLKIAYALPEEIASELYDSPYFNLFKKLSKEKGAEPKLIAATFTNTVKSIQNSKILQEKHFEELFSLYAEKKFSKEAIPKIIEAWVKNPGERIEKIIEGTGIIRIPRAEIEKIIEEIILKNQKLIQEQGERALQPLMGDVMKELRGKADGKEIIEILKAKIKELHKL